MCHNANNYLGWFWEPKPSFCVALSPYTHFFQKGHMHLTRARMESRRQMSCPFLKILNPASFATKMEAIRIVHDRNILNPFSERFNKRYLVNAVDCPSVRDDILSTIHSHFDNHSKDHYVRKRVVSINHDSEIAGVKESKLNVCKICFNHCALN